MWGKIKKALFFLGGKIFKFSNWVVVGIVIMNIWFTKQILELFAFTSVEPTTLIISFFGFTTGELWMLASIKKTKVKKDYDNHLLVESNEEVEEYDAL